MNKPALTSEPLLEAIQHRWSPRSFDSKPVSVANIRKVMEAARWAASSYNEQPWAFIVASKDHPEEYEKALSCLIEFNQGWARSAPVLILTLAKVNFEKNQKPNTHAWHDLGIATGQLAVQAEALGLRAHAMGGILPDKIRQIYEVPAEFQPVAAIALGYPGAPELLPEPLSSMEKAPRERKSLGKIVFGKKFGLSSSIVIE